MPKIKPFCALRAAPALLTNVVTRPLEHYGLGEARLIASENPISFLHLISPELDNPYLRGSRQELVYKMIAEHFEEFVENKTLISQDKPAIYIYEVQHDGMVQTGIWTLTHIDNYLEGKIKKHELTIERRESLLAEYLLQTGIDANPVLITYHSNPIVQSLIKKYTALKPNIDLAYVDDTQHRIWAIENTDDLKLMINAFAEIPTVYIADGHHRAASMARMSKQRKKLLNDKNADFNYFTTVYMDTQQLKILAFNRVIRDLAGLTENEFIDKLSDHFQIEKVDHAITPVELHHFAMYLKSGWYTLTAKAHTYDEDPVNVLDVSILQNYVLIPILNINDPRTDSRITFEGGKSLLSKLEHRINNNLDAVAFVLFPTSISQLMDVANANEVMPPKSTWVEPKFLVGLLTHYFSK